METKFRIIEAWEPTKRPFHVERFNGVNWNILQSFETTQEASEFIRLLRANDNLIREFNSANSNR